VPFHISTITNVSINSEGQWTYLRINFHAPSKSGSDSYIYPDMTDPNAIFVKELTLKNSDHRGENNHLKKAEKQIKDLIKKGKMRDQEEDEKNQAGLQPLQLI